MPTVTLSVKAYNESQLKLVEQSVRSMLKGLKVNKRNFGLTSRRWVQLEVSGEDEKVALTYLASRIGVCPTLLKNVERPSSCRGYISSIGREELNIDIGVFEPSSYDAVVTLQHLQAQLADGKKVALEKLAELFGFSPNLPLVVRTGSVHVKRRRIDATLTPSQITLYREWTKLLLDRLIISGASSAEVRLALKRSQCYRDVIGFEPLGFLEHSVICKLGTDAKGLVPKIGRQLTNAILTVFSPRKNVRLLGDYMLL